MAILNDYGRAVSATAISDRLLVSDSTSEEELGQQSAFNFSGWDKILGLDLKLTTAALT